MIPVIEPVSVKPLIHPDLPIDERSFSEWKLHYRLQLIDWFCQTRAERTPQSDAGKIGIELRSEYGIYATLMFEYQIAQEIEIARGAV